MLDQHREEDPEAQVLLPDPPNYNETEHRGPLEQFEVEDPIDQSSNGSHNGGDTSPGWLTSVKKFSAERISIPVRHVIDPIAHFWHNVSVRFVATLSRYMNPLVAQRIFVVFAASAIILVVHFTYIRKGTNGGSLRNHSRLQDFIKSKLDLGNIKESTTFFSKMPHYAGSAGDTTTSNYVHDYFESLGLMAAYDRHEVFLSHGNRTLCELKEAGKVLWQSELIESEAIENPEASQIQPRTQMAMVLPGEAEGPLVFGNFGTEEDFAQISARGSIVLVKYSREVPGDVALRAERHGAAGLLFMSVKSPSEPSWPHGRDYPADAIQQGSLGSGAMYPGDILSPGWPSSMDMTLSLDAAHIAHIPAAAISWNDAEPLLNSIKGFGVRMDAVHAEWANNGAPQGVHEWWTGPNPSSTVKLVTEPQAENRHIISNVFGNLKGRDGARVIVIGARLDAMCYGTSQLAGLNVMLEVARLLADLKYTEQWEPLRSIFFTAWDGTAHNQAGSVEWVEAVAKSLSKEGIAYIDLDLGLSGPDFLVQGNPLIQVEELLKQVDYDGGSLWDAVDKRQSFKPIPGYGNHLAFEAHTGVPTVRFGFHSKDRPVPVDSCFDNLAWMEKYGDPDYGRHRSLTEFVTYLALELSDAPMLPFDFVNLGEQIVRYVNFIEDRAREKFGETDPNGFSRRCQEAVDWARAAGNSILESGKKYGMLKQQWDELYTENRDPKSGDFAESLPVSRVRMYWNEKAAQANKLTNDVNGIHSRNWYKNHLFGPESIFVSETELSGMFPAVRDVIEGPYDDQTAETFSAVLTDAANHLNEMAQYLDNILM